MKKMDMKQIGHIDSGDQFILDGALVEVREICIFNNKPLIRIYIPEECRHNQFYYKEFCEKVERRV